MFTEQFSKCSLVIIRANLSTTQRKILSWLSLLEILAKLPHHLSLTKFHLFAVEQMKFKKSTENAGDISPVIQRLDMYYIHREANTGQN